MRSSRMPPDVRSFLYCFKPPFPRTAASPPPRRAVGAFDPEATRTRSRSVLDQSAWLTGIKITGGRSTGPCEQVECALRVIHRPFCGTL